MNTYCVRGKKSYLPCTRQLRAKQGQFKPGIADENSDAALAWAHTFDWNGPFILAVDDTKLTPALQSYRSGSEWYLAGFHGVVHSFSTYEELLALSNTDGENLAEKVCEHGACIL